MNTKQREVTEGNQSNFFPPPSYIKNEVVRKRLTSVTFGYLFTLSQRCRGGVQPLACEQSASCPERSGGGISAALAARPLIRPNRARNGLTNRCSTPAAEVQFGAVDAELRCHSAAGPTTSRAGASPGARATEGALSSSVAASFHRCARARVGYFALRALGATQPGVQPGCSRAGRCAAFLFRCAPSACCRSFVAAADAFPVSATLREPGCARGSQLGSRPFAHSTGGDDG